MIRVGMVAGKLGILSPAESDRGLDCSGERSFGSSGNQKPQELVPGIALSIPCWEAHDTDGRLIEGRGIDPDETVIFRREADGDAVLDAGLKWIRK